MELFDVNNLFYDKIIFDFISDINKCRYVYIRNIIHSYKGNDKNMYFYIFDKSIDKYKLINKINTKTEFRQLLNKIYMLNKTEDNEHNINLQKELLDVCFKYEKYLP